MKGRKKKAPVIEPPRLDLGWIDDAGEWHSFPPLPSWDAGELREGEWVKVDGFRRKVVRDPMPLFRSTLPATSPSTLAGASPTAGRQSAKGQ